MKLDKKIVLKITKEERDTLKAFTNIIEEAFNINIEDDCPELLTEIISGIYGGYKKIHTSMDDIEIEYITSEEGKQNG